MAARVYYSNSSAGESSWNTDVNFQDKCSITFTPGASKTHLHMFLALAQNSSTSFRTNTRLHNGTSALAEGSFRPSDATDYVSVFGLAIETYGGSPSSQTLKYQYGTTSTSGTARTKNAALLSIELDASEPFTSGAGPVSCTNTTDTTVATLTHSFANGADYYILAYAETDTGSAAHTTRMKLVEGANTYGACELDHEDASDKVAWGTIKKFTGDGTSKTFTMYGSSGNSTGTNTVTNYVLVALKKSVFESADYAESLGRSTTTSATYQDKTTLTSTPAAVNYLVLGSGIIDTGSTSSSAFGQLLEGATSKGEQIRESATAGTAGGGWAYLMGYVSSLTAASTTWKTQYKSESAGTTTGIADSAILILQLDAAVADTTIGGHHPYFSRFIGGIGM